MPARGRAEVEAAEGGGDRTKDGVAGASKDRNEPRLIDRSWGAVSAGRQWGALAACAYFAQLIEKSGGDGFCSCVGLRLGLCKDVASVMCRRRSNPSGPSRISTRSRSFFSVSRSSTRSRRTQLRAVRLSRLCEITKRSRLGRLHARRLGKSRGRRSALVGRRRTHIALL